MRNTISPSLLSWQQRLGVDRQIHSPHSDLTMQMGSNINVLGGNFSLQAEANNNLTQLGYGGMTVPLDTYSLASISGMSHPTLADYHGSMTSCNSNTRSQKLLPHQAKPATKDKRKRLEGNELLETSSSPDPFRNMEFPEDLNMRKKRKVVHQPVIDAQELMTPVRRSQRISDKITALQKLVSPYGKTDTASVLQEACIYIKIAHQDIQRLSISYSGARCHQFQRNGEQQSELQSRGLRLVPVSSTDRLEKEDSVDYQVASRTRRLLN